MDRNIFTDRVITKLRIKKMPNSGKISRSKKSIRIGAILWLLIPVCLSPIHYAHAYLDAGTGSYAIQVAIGMIFGATYTLKTFGGRIVQYFKDRRFNGQKEE